MERKPISTGKISEQSIAKRAFLIGAAIIALSLLPQGKATAQSGAGPMTGATPSDKPVAAAQSTQPAAKPNLAGSWKLNADQSDNPMQKMREAMQDSGNGNGNGGGGFGGGGGRRGGGGGGFGGGGGNGGGFGGNGGGYGGGQGQQNGQADGSANGPGPGPGANDDQQNAQNRRRGGGGMQAMSQLLIEQSPTSAKVSDNSGRVIALYQAQPQQGSANSDTNTPVAQWQDSKLVTTTQTPNGGSTTRTYEISSDKKQLIVTTTMQNKRLKEPVTYKQVYDPVTVSTGGD